MIDHLLERIAALEHRLANTQLSGPVVERDHMKGVRIDLGPGVDGKPCLSDWFQPGDRTGAGRYLPREGEQVIMIAMNGDWRQAVSVPFTHSDAKPNPAKNADQTVHHDRDGQRHAVEKGHVTEQAEKKISRGAGDGGKEGEGSGKSGANLPHELNRQLQGIRATLTQHDNHIAGLHDATSQFRDIVQRVIPGVQAVEHLLKGDPESLGKAAEGVLGKLEGYVAKTFEQMIGKLTNGFMSNVMGLVQGAMQGQFGGLLDQVEALATEHAIAAAGAPLAAARAAIGAATGGGGGAMGLAMGGLGQAFAGTPGEAAFGLLAGRMQGLLGAASGIAANLSGALDAQQNLVKGLTKSERLGGYEGED